MASWVTHLMIADKVLGKISGLDKHGFCVGNIAPDCNVENKDWTCFTPSRAVTHWMSGERKMLSDCDRFYKEYIENRMCDIDTEEEYSFLMGYYSHLITDAEFQRFIRGENRVASVWKRIKAHSVLLEKSSGMQENWDSVKILIGKKERMKDIYSMEADYLEQHPESGYFTEILKLTDFPDYIDYLPKGAIARKISVMGYIPTKEISAYPYIAMSKEEYEYFVDNAVNLIAEAFEHKKYHRNSLEKVKRKVYLDMTEEIKCISVFVKDAEVIQTGATVYSMSVKDKNAEYQRFADEYDIYFIFDDDIPKINFYTVPRVDIMAVDSCGGYIGTVGETCDLDSGAPICYIDKDMKCFLVAENFRSFLEKAKLWKTQLEPYNEIKVFRSKAEAEEEYAFFDRNLFFNEQPVQELE